MREDRWRKKKKRKEAEIGEADSLAGSAMISQATIWADQDFTVQQLLALIKSAFRYNDLFLLTSFDLSIFYMQCIGQSLFLDPSVSILHSSGQLEMGSLYIP